MKIIFYSLLIILPAGCQQKINERPEQPAEGTYSPVSIELYNTIMEKDSIFFEACNKKDLSTAKTFFSEDLEFYHDKDGLADYETTIRNLEELFKNNQSTGLTRKLVPGSSEVFPIHNYGAIQTGLHTFCHDEHGKQDCGTFKFIHLWQLKDSAWKITRVFSYDHR